MKTRAIIVLAATMMAFTVPVIAQQTHQERVICQLAANNCLNQAEILQKRVKKLNAEITKGTKTYSADDLKKLELKLQETLELLDKVEGKAPAK